jgi:hypothetical protein
MEHNINIDYKEIICETVDWIRLARDSVKRQVLLNKIMNRHNFLTS